MNTSKNNISNVILIVEDEWLLRWSLEKTLTKHGHEVHTAVSGQEALEILKDKSVDWLVTDLRMQGIDGFEVMSAAKRIFPDIKLILMTAYGSAEVEKKAKQLGANYITKPFDLDYFVDKLLT